MLEGMLATLGAALMTALGEAVALRFKTRLPHLAAFAAGSLVATALLDLIPEALELWTDDRALLMLVAGGGFLLFYTLERLTLFHAHPEEEASAAHTRVGALGAVGVTLQSLLDGAAIGLGFEAGADVGLLVGLAVLLHKLSDGASTVGLILVSGNPSREAFKWLALASLAPLVGFGLTALFSLSTAGLAALLAFFAGTFLFLGASHLLPKAHEADPAPEVAVATLVGFGLVALVGWLVNVG